MLLILVWVTGILLRLVSWLKFDSVWLFRVVCMLSWLASGFKVVCYDHFGSMAPCSSLSYFKVSCFVLVLIDFRPRVFCSLLVFNVVWFVKTSPWIIWLPIWQRMTKIRSSKTDKSHDFSMTSSAIRTRLSLTKEDEDDSSAPPLSL